MCGWKFNHENVICENLFLSRNWQKKTIRSTYPTKILGYTVHRGYGDLHINTIVIAGNFHSMVKN